MRGITYGGYLIASLKFEAKSEKAKEDVEASVKGNFKTAGNSVDVALEGQFKMLSEAVKDVSSLSISYTATAPLKTVPTDIESLVQAIKDFPKLVSFYCNFIWMIFNAKLPNKNPFSFCFNHSYLSFCFNHETC